MATFHKTKHMRHHILSHQNFPDKIGNAIHKKFLPVALHTSEIAHPGNITADRL